MKAILLDGSNANDATAGRVADTLKVQLLALGWNIEYILLREKKIGNCSGDFFCWIRTPGMCNLNDDNRTVAAAILASDLLVYLTPVTFGGYSYQLKRMVDHQIQNISPFFMSLDGETHHEKRYDKYPDFLVVGWMDSPDEKAEAIFKNLVHRNAINFYAKTFLSDVILTGQSDIQLTASAQRWLRDIINGQSSLSIGVPAECLIFNGDVNVRRALLLVGSPRGRKSNSNSLGTYLFSQLSDRDIETETIYIYNTLRSVGKMEGLMNALNEADLIVLVFPLYVDSLPAPLIDVLERICAERQGKENRRQLFAAVANCGFPEAAHNTTALSICEMFAGEAGFEWAGSLAMGGGEAIGGVPLIQGGGKTMRIRKSLDIAADALGKGQYIPKTASDLMAKPMIPHWVYRMMGGMGWKKQAKHYGADEALNNKPYSLNS